MDMCGVWCMVLRSLESPVFGPRASATELPPPSHDGTQPGLVVTCKSSGPQARRGQRGRGHEYTLKVSQRS